MKLNFWADVFILARIRRVFLYLTLEFSAMLPAFNTGSFIILLWLVSDKPKWKCIECIENALTLVVIILPEQCVEFIGMKPVKHSHLGR